MIRQIFLADNIQLGHNIIGGKIASAVAAYGLKYDFCRLYFAESGGYILAYNGSMLCDGIFDTDELSDFAGMLNPDNIEVSSDIALHIDGGYKRVGRTLFQLVPRENNIEAACVKSNTLLNECFEILSAGFGLNDFESWYVDISHRIRHGVSEIYLYNSTTVTKVFDHDNIIFLSHVATSPKERGKGTARNLLYYLCEQLSENGKKVYLFARDDRRSFYESAGFVPVKYAYFYEMCKGE